MPALLAPGREVRYVRWKAWVRVAWCASLVAAGLALATVGGLLVAGLLVAFGGAMATHVALLPLLEKDVLLRLTPAGTWTKELGAVPWPELEVQVIKTRGGHPNTLLLTRRGQDMPRFLEALSALDISYPELHQWLAQYYPNR